MTPHCPALLQWRTILFLLNTFRGKKALLYASPGWHVIFITWAHKGRGFVFFIFCVQQAMEHPAHNIHSINESNWTKRENLEDQRQNKKQTAKQKRTGEKRPHFRPCFPSPFPSILWQFPGQAPTLQWAREARWQDDEARGILPGSLILMLWGRCIF